MAAHLTWLVIVLQAAMLVTLRVSKPLPRPPRIQFFELIWAWMHEPHFYPLAALVAGGVPLTIIAMTIKGSHRIALGIAWMTFAVLIAIYDAQRFLLMLRSLYWAAMNS